MKNFLKVVVALLVVLVVGFFVLISRINTDANKQRIADGFQQATGYQLVIGGDLSLDLFPSFGLTLNDVRLRNPAVPQELASSSRAVLRAELMPLTRGELLVQEISADDFHVNYFINPDGRSIWQLDEPAAEVTATAGDPASPGEAGGSTALSVERFRIANASIDMQDQSRGSRMRIDEFNLDSRNTNINGDPFSFEIEFEFENNGMSAPIPVNLQGEIVADLSAGEVTASNLQLSITPMLVTGQAGLTGLGDTPEYNGTFSADSFDLQGLLQSLGLVADQPQALGQVSAERALAFSLRFEGDASQLAVPELNMNLAGTSISADANIRMATDFAPASVSYNLNAGNLDLTPFLPQASAEAQPGELADGNPALQASPAPGLEQETELPVELISSISLLGSISIESVRAGEFQFFDVNVFTNIEDGVMDIEVPPISAFEGQVQGTVRLNTQSRVPELGMTLATSDINLVNLAPSVSRFSTVTGFLQSESAYSATGNTSSALLGSLNGNTAFNITENSVDIGVIKQVFTAIAALSPTGEAIQQWPDVIRFTELSGYLLLEDGLDSNQQLKLRMDNFDISGSGGLDLAAGSFDFDLQFAVLGEPYTQTIPINSLYHNVSWPVDCSGQFSDEVSRFCRPDFTRVREIFTQIGTNAARGRLEEAITDQLPDQLQDTARGLLRSILN